MITSKISFCGTVAWNINCDLTKDTILQEIDKKYNAKVITRHWQNLTPTSYDSVIRHGASLCLRTNGNPYFMYFTTWDGVPIVLFIDKKIQCGYYKPRIIVGTSLFRDTSGHLFDGTLIDGEMQRDKDNHWHFVTNDILAFEGKPVNDDLSSRVDTISRIFDAHVRSPMDPCTYEIKKYFPLTSDGIRDIQDFSISLPYVSRGMYVYPWSKARQRPILVNFDDTMIKDVTKVVKTVNQFFVSADSSPGPGPQSAPSTPAPSTPTTPPCDPESYVILSLQSTELPDVYRAWDGPEEKKEGVCVPNLATSKMLQDAFRTCTLTIKINFKCIKHPTFNRWMPIVRAE